MIRSLLIRYCLSMNVEYLGDCFGGNKFVMGTYNAVRNACHRDFGYLSLTFRLFWVSGTLDLSTVDSRPLFLGRNGSSKFHRLSVFL
jgi:hypothetical protein